VADATATFAITLQDMLSPSAAKAKASISALSTELKGAKTQLAGYQSQLALAKELGDVAGYKKYSGLVQGAQKSVFDLAQRAEASSGSLTEGAASAGTMATSLGLVSVAAGLAAAAIGGLVVVTGSLVLKSLEVVNANQQLTASFEALGGAGSGKKTLDMLDGLSNKLPQSREQLAQWTREIEKTGVTDLSKIRSELIATASAQAIMQDPAAASAYLKLQEKVNHAIEKGSGLKMADTKASRALFAAGLNEADVARRMGLTTAELSAKLKAGTADAKKFGDAMSSSLQERGKGSLDAQMNSLSVMGQKAKESLAHLFDGVDTKPLTDALRGLVALGDQGAPSGQALKMGITGGLNGIISALGGAITKAEIFFLKLEILGLQTYIAVKPLISAYDKIANVLGAASGKVGTAVGGAEKGAGVEQGTIKDAATQAGGLFLGSFTSFLPQIANAGLEAIASIGNAKAQEVAHQQGVAIGKSTLAGVKDGLGVHSPSVEAMKIGMNVGLGLGMGMEDSPAPARAARTISSNALGGIGGAKAIGAANGNAGAAGGPMSNVFHINITAPDGVTDAHAISVVGLATALERYQIGSGR
jgi:hypothetical protein